MLPCKGCPNKNATETFLLEQSVPLFETRIEFGYQPLQVWMCMKTASSWGYHHIIPNKSVSKQKTMTKRTYLVNFYFTVCQSDQVHVSSWPHQGFKSVPGQYSTIMVKFKQTAYKLLGCWLAQTMSCSDPDPGQGLLWGWSHHSPRAISGCKVKFPQRPTRLYISTF